MVLVDTSIWIDHFRSGRRRLKQLLYDDQVLGHPYIVGELACGHLSSRREILRLLQQLPQAKVAEHDEILAFIESRRLMGQGIGFVDAHLLAAVLLSQARLWTRDNRLLSAAEFLNIPLIG